MSKKESYWKKGAKLWHPYDLRMCEYTYCNTWQVDQDHVYVFFNTDDGHTVSLETIVMRQFEMEGLPDEHKITQAEHRIVEKVRQNNPRYANSITSTLSRRFYGRDKVRDEDR